MITLKYNMFDKGSIDSAIGKLANHSKFSPNYALKIYRLIDLLSKEKDRIASEYSALVKEHAKLDEQGKIIPREDFAGRKIPHSFEAKDKETWDKAAEEFGEKTFDLRGDLIPILSLEGIPFTPLEMAALEPILDMEVKNGEKEDKKIKALKEVRA